MSGVKLTEGCMLTYQDIQKSKKHRYAVFVIREGQIDVETVSERTPTFWKRQRKCKCNLLFRLVLVTVPLQNSWWISIRRRERARTVDTVSMITSTLSVLMVPSQHSNPNCSWWVGAQMAPRSRRKCSTPQGEWIFSQRYYAIGHISLLQLRHPEESICGSSQGHSGKWQERVRTGYY